MKKYTVGFIFNKSHSKVLLVHKISPEWQNGKINGVGGKLEEGETSLDCIVREVREETSLKTKKNDWVLVGRIFGDDWFVDVFGATYNGKLSDAKKADKEEVEWFSVKSLPDNVIKNLTWLVPVTLDKMLRNNFKEIEVRYH